MNTEFTTIYFDYGLYSKNKTKIQNLRSIYGLKWNQSKMRMGISYDNMLEAFKQIKCENRIIDDENLKDRTGSVGLWQSETEALKIMMFDKRNEDEHLPILLVYKGDENLFYNEIIKLCAKIGCEIGKIVEENGKFEEVFKKRINIELIEKFDSVNGTKQVMKDIFEKKIGYGKFSALFVERWKECIDKYGNYTLMDLYNEIEKNNQKRELESRVEESIDDNKNIMENLKIPKFRFKSKKIDKED